MVSDWPIVNYGTAQVAQTSGMSGSCSKYKEMHKNIEES